MSRAFAVVLFVGAAQIAIAAELSSRDLVGAVADWQKRRVEEDAEMGGDLRSIEPDGSNQALGANRRPTCVYISDDQNSSN